MPDHMERDKEMSMKEKIAWIDEKNRIVSFHPIDNSRMIMKAEKLFWDYIIGLTRTGYRVIRVVDATI